MNTFQGLPEHIIQSSNTRQVSRRIWRRKKSEETSVHSAYLSLSLRQQNRFFINSSFLSFEFLNQFNQYNECVILITLNSKTTISRQWPSEPIISPSPTRLQLSFNATQKSPNPHAFQIMRVVLLPIITKQRVGLNIVQSFKQISQQDQYY